MTRARWVVLTVVLALGAVMVPVGPTVWHMLTTVRVFNPGARTEGGDEIVTRRRWGDTKHGFSRHWHLGTPLPGFGELLITDGGGPRHFTEGVYVGGRPHGLFTCYDAQGNVFHQVQFDYGEILWGRTEPPWQGDAKSKEEVLRIVDGEP